MSVRGEDKQSIWIGDSKSLRMAIVYNRIRAGKEDTKSKEVWKDAAKGGSGLLGKPLPHGLSSCHMHEDNTILYHNTLFQKCKGREEINGGSKEVKKYDEKKYCLYGGYVVFLGMSSTYGFSLQRLQYGLWPEEMLWEQL